MKVRSLFALALAALLAPAAASAAPARAGSSMDQLSVGGFIGYETDDLDGLSLRLDGELPFQSLSPQLNLSWVGSIGYSYLTWDGFGFGSDITAHVLKIIPAARFTFPVNPQLDLFADAGLGLYYASIGVDDVDPVTEDFIEDELGGLGLMMRIGGGAWYRVNPTTRIGAAIELDPYFGDFDQTTFIIHAGAMLDL